MLNERLYSLREIRPKLPVRRSLRTLKRWSIVGATAKRGSGPRIRLEVVCVAGSLHTSLEAVERFLERLTRERQALDSPRRDGG